MFEFTTFSSSILFKLYSFHYYYKHYDFFKTKHNQITISPAIRYTDLSAYLTIIWSFYILYKKKSPPRWLTASTWCILNNASIAYWVFKKHIINSIKDPEHNTYLYKTSEIVTHGGSLILMLLDLHRHPFGFKDIKYPIYLSLFWYIFVIKPSELYYNSHLYPFLSKDSSLKLKLIIFSSMFGINLFSGTVGSIVSKNPLIKYYY